MLKYGDKVRIRSLDQIGTITDSPAAFPGKLGVTVQEEEPMELVDCSDIEIIRRDGKHFMEVRDE